MNENRLAEALRELLTFLPDESTMLDNASLNDGRANAFDMAAVKARKILYAHDAQRAEMKASPEHQVDMLMARTVVREVVIPPAAQRAEGAGVPDGYVLAPREPTPEMLDAIKDMTFSVRVAEDDSAEYPVSEDDCAEIYRNMLAAAPSKE